MELQDFIRQQRGRGTRPTGDLFSVAVYENEEWITLPEKHHKESLAIQVCIAEAKSRNLPASIVMNLVDPLSDARFILTYWPMGITFLPPPSR